MFHGLNVDCAVTIFYKNIDYLMENHVAMVKINNKFSV